MVAVTRWLLLASMLRMALLLRPTTRQPLDSHHICAVSILLPRPSRSWGRSGNEEKPRFESNIPTTTYACRQARLPGEQQQSAIVRQEESSPRSPRLRP